MTRYLPAEMIVLVDADQGALLPDKYRPLYEGTMDWLNTNIAQILRNQPPPSADFGNLFEEDMFPKTLATRCSGFPSVLGPPKANGGRDPWVPLPDSGKLLCFYDINSGNDPWSDDQNVAVVRELVNVVNRRLLARPFAERASSPAVQPAVQGRVIASTPHWLAAGAQSGFTDGGPAARPKPEQHGRWRFDFDDERLTELVQNPGQAPVVVAVLDSSPTLQQVHDAAGRYPQNWLLQEIVSPTSRFTVDEDLSVSSDILKRLDHYVPSWRHGLLAGGNGGNGGASNGNGTAGDGHDAHLPSEHYLMPDHGLFTASIIHQLAPKAEIHLIRVLSDYGVGDLLALADVLRQLPGKLNPNGDRRLVVNLSLVAGMPSGGPMMGMWFPNSVNSLAAVTDWHVDIARTLDFAHRTLAETVSWLTDQGALVVAAAGNDATGTSSRPEPRIPARYDEVLAVAAVQRNSDRPSDFSNRGDVAIMGNGVAVFGGNAHPAEGAGADDPWITVDGVVGAFSSEELPLGGGKNTTGWAAWAGTSFATPICTAIAADILSRAPDLSPARVIEHVRLYARLTDDPLDRDGPLDCPTIVATQVQDAPAAT